MTAMNADVYALCEVVNPDSLRAVVSSLPGGYAYALSTFGSFASDTASAKWMGAQKLALVYRKDLLRNVSGRAMMTHSSTAYNAFASGRFPYEVSAEVKGRDGEWRSVNFIVLHAKAMADDQSCSRRVDGCRELKDSLDRYEPSARFLVLGDFNDDLDVSNCGGYFPQSNYWYMVRDSLRYVPLTLAISRAGAFSSDGYTSLIDHVVASDEMARYYVPGSAEVLRSFVKGIFPNYDNDISDHFPVRTSYVMDAVPTAVPQHAAGSLRVFPNPAAGLLHVEGAGWQRYSVYDLQGRALRQAAFPANGAIQLELPNGLYLLRVEGGEGSAQRPFRIAQ